MTLFEQYAAHVDHALDALVASKTLPSGIDRANVTVEPPRDPSHGDISTNAAMVLAKPAGLNPRQLADALSAELAKVTGVTAVEIAGPGFLNLRLDASAWLDELRAIAHSGDDYGRSHRGDGKSVNIEYVSANPTGPMHMGHCRGAVVGDALAALMEFAGYRVVREYYINDAGGQVDVLARSAHLRYREALGETIEIAEGLYPGDYLIPVGQRLAERFGDQYVAQPEAEWLALFRKAAVAEMMKLFNQAAQKPFPTKEESGRTLSESMMVLGTASAMYDSQTGWPQLRKAIAEAQRGFGDTFLKLADEYTGRQSDGSFPNNEFDSGAVIDCLDFNEPRSVERIRSDAQAFATKAPLFGPYLAYGGVTCKFFNQDTEVSIEPMTTSNPVIVIGTTGDPATPYEWAQGLSKLLTNSRLISLTGEGHTGQGQGNACIDDQIDDFYLLSEMPSTRNCR